MFVNKLLTLYFSKITQVSDLPRFLVFFNFLVTPLLEVGGPPTAPRVRKRPHESVVVFHRNVSSKFN